MSPTHHWQGGTYRRTIVAAQGTTIPVAALLKDSDAVLRPCVILSAAVSFTRTAAATLSCLAIIFAQSPMLIRPGKPPCAWSCPSPGPGPSAIRQEASPPSHHFALLPAFEVSDCPEYRVSARQVHQALLATVRANATTVTVMRRALPKIGAEAICSSIGSRGRYLERRPCVRCKSGDAG